MLTRTSDAHRAPYIGRLGPGSLALHARPDRLQQVQQSVVQQCSESFCAHHPPTPLPVFELLSGLHLHCPPSRQSSCNTCAAMVRLAEYKG